MSSQARLAVWSSVSPCEAVRGGAVDAAAGTHHHGTAIANEELQHGNALDALVIDAFRLAGLVASAYSTNVNLKQILRTISD